MQIYSLNPCKSTDQTLSRWSCDICSSSYGFDDMTATCLACTAPQGIPDSFDMCQACFAQTMTDESKETVFISAIHGQKHRSYHRVVFLRIMLHFRQRAGLIKQAKSAFKRCRVEYESGWTCCMICHKEVDLPCLSCIGCRKQLHLFPRICNSECCR